MRQTMRRWLCLCVVVLLCGASGCSPQQPSVPDFSGEAQTLSIGSPVKHYFDALDNTEKQVYNAILSQIDMFPERIAVPVLTTEQLEKAYAALLYDNPELFYLSLHSQVRQTKQIAYLFPQYLTDREDYVQMRQSCADAAAAIVREAEGADTPFEKELIVHDRLIEMCEYTDDDDPFRGSVYGVLCAGSASCAGYAKAAKYILDMLQIPCYVVPGVSTPPGSTSDSHLWNIVQLDGQYYHLDLTWDDPVVANNTPLVQHTYFNLTDAEISKTHSAYSGTDPCTSVEQNYFIHEHLLFSDYGEAEKMRTVEIAVQSIREGNRGFQLCFGNETAFDRAQKVLFDEQEIYTLLRQIRSQTDQEFATDRASYLIGTNMNMIDVILE